MGRGDSHLLLLFYGIECGLKSIYFMRNKILKTDQINEKNNLLNHDLFGIAKKLKLPAQTLSITSNSFRSSTGMALEIKHVHECFRYGIKIHPDDLENLVKLLLALKVWIKDNI